MFCSSPASSTTCGLSKPTSDLLTFQDFHPTRSGASSMAGACPCFSSLSKNYYVCQKRWPCYDMAHPNIGRSTIHVWLAYAPLKKSLKNIVLVHILQIWHFILTLALTRRTASKPAPVYLMHYHNDMIYMVLNVRKCAQSSHDFKQNDHRMLTAQFNIQSSRPALNSYFDSYLHHPCNWFASGHSNVLIIAIGKRPTLPANEFGEPNQENQLWNSLEDAEVLEVSCPRVLNARFYCWMNVNSECIFSSLHMVLQFCESLSSTSSSWKVWQHAMVMYTCTCIIHLLALTHKASYMHAGLTNQDLDLRRCKRWLTRQKMEK